MTEEEKELFDAYKTECGAAWELAQELDTRYSETPSAFCGTPTVRIHRQLKHILEDN